MFKLLLGVFVFPGLISTVVLGCLYFWEYRKLRARLQARIGPPWYQVFLDLIKLFSKESIIPRSANRVMFTLAPLLALSSLLATTLFIPVVNVKPVISLSADLLVVIYLLALPSIALVLAGYSSSSPYGYVGSARELTMSIWYELCMVVSVLAVAIASGSLSMEGIVKNQIERGLLITRLPLAFVAMLFATQAKLCKRPFDVVEAETEIVKGPLTEYSGSLLALLHLSEGVKWFVLPCFLVSLFLGAGVLTGNPWVNLLLTLVVLIPVLVFLFSLIDAINPRYRVDQALKLLWKVALPLAVIDLIRAIVGLGV